MSMMETENRIFEIASRIRELREISGYTQQEMAQRVDTSLEEYRNYEAGKVDLPFSFIHKCALACNVEITDLLEGSSARLTSYTVTRRGAGQITAQEDGIEIQNLAPMFRNKLAEPYWVRYDYSEELQNQPIHCATHSGQEFDLVLSGQLKVQVGNHTEILYEGDSIYYNSSTPHGMIAVGGRECLFCAVVLNGDDQVVAPEYGDPVKSPMPKRGLVSDAFVDAEEDEKGVLKNISFKNKESFNFAFDIVDVMGREKPDKLAMIHLDHNRNERRFTFRQISRDSSRAANYFKSLGIKKGDRVMLVLRRHYQFWLSILGLHKLGAIVIPATDQLLEHDYVYRFQAADVRAIVCTAMGRAAEEVEKALPQCPGVQALILAEGSRDGWHSFDEEYKMFSSSFPRTEQTPCGNDPMLMFFTSGTTGYPKIALHSFTYPLAHYVTAKYWHCVDPEGVHLTISDTGWGKALWGKLYGQWLCEGAVFVYDFDRFDAADILPMFAKYHITTFCAPPTMYRFLIREDISRYDLSSIQHATVAGEALNPEVAMLFKKATGLTLMEGFGQTETTLSIANLYGMTPKLGSMGKPVPLFDVDIVDPDGNPVPVGETGEVIIRADQADNVCGLFKGYFKSEEKTQEVWHDGVYHTGDTAWRDEDGYFWYVGRVDDVIKSSGYRIGPFEIESVLMELPYVLECGVSAAPDPIRGQVVKASIVLTKGTEPTEELKKEIQNYVKQHTAPYKYPRIIVFRNELPKTISGKIQRHLL